MQGHPPRLRLVLLDLTASPAVPPTTRTLTYEPYTRLFGSTQYHLQSSHGAVEAYLMADG